MQLPDISDSTCRARLRRRRGQLQNAVSLHTRSSSVGGLVHFLLLLHWCAVPLLSNENAASHAHTPLQATIAPRFLTPPAAGAKRLLPAAGAKRALMSPRVPAAVVALHVNDDFAEQGHGQGPYANPVTIAVIHPSLVALAPTGSPLQVESALRVGDEVASIDDVPAWQLGPRGVQAIFREAGTEPLRITVRSAGAPPESPPVAMLVQLVSDSTSLPGTLAKGALGWDWVHSIGESPDARAVIHDAVQVIIQRTSCPVQALRLEEYDRFSCP